MSRDELDDLYDFDLDGFDLFDNDIKANSEKLLRQKSGIDVDPESIQDYIIIRSILMDNDNNVKLEQTLIEIFKGLNSFEIFGHPSAILLKNNASIVMPSQIYDRNYSMHKNHYQDITTFDNYFKARKVFHEINPDIKAITWLGAPSIVFTYKNRNILKEHLNNNPVINLFFWITSFNSSKCIIDYSNEARDKKIPYCNKYEEIKKFCKNKDEYQIHKTYYNNYINTKEPIRDKYITDFDTAINAILVEEDAIKKYNEENKTNEFQRYNELFTYFFPWDIDGIERGGISNEKLQQLLVQINVQRLNIILDLEKIKIDSNFIGNINSIIILILKQNYKDVKKFLEINFFSYTYFLLAKYIALAQCDVIEGKQKYLKLKKNDSNRITLLINSIIEIMSLDLNIYEYELDNDTNKFKTTITDTFPLINNNKTINNRVSPFILFEQIEEDHLTHVFRANQQLSENVNENVNTNGGKKKEHKKKENIKKENIKMYQEKTKKIRFSTNSITILQSCIFPNK
jgi:hypothetical protein